jgi:two-component system sensor histidine kinase BarA
VDDESAIIHWLPRPASRKSVIAELLATSRGNSPFQHQTSLSAKTITRRKGSVLIAEDNSFNLDLLRHHLTYTGFDCTTTTNGIAALREANVSTYDLIFLDIHMPLMDGISAAKAIKNQTVNAKTPIIAITADLFSNRKGEKAFDDVLHKPISRESLHTVIARHYKTSIDFSNKNMPFPPELISRATHELTAAIANLESFLSSLDYTALREEAHKLRGMVCYFDNTDYRDLVENLSDSIHQKNNHGIESVIHKLKSISMLNKKPPQ